MRSRQYKTDSWEQGNKQGKPYTFPNFCLKAVFRRCEEENSNKGQWSCWVEETEIRVIGKFKWLEFMHQTTGEKSYRMISSNLCRVFSWFWGWTLNCLLMVKFRDWAPNSYWQQPSNSQSSHRAESFEFLPATVDRSH